MRRRRGGWVFSRLARVVGGNRCRDADLSRPGVRRVWRKLAKIDKRALTRADLSRDHMGRRRGAGVRPRWRHCWRSCVLVPILGATEPARTEQRIAVPMIGGMISRLALRGASFLDLWLVKAGATPSRVAATAGIAFASEPVPPPPNMDGSMDCQAVWTMCHHEDGPSSVSEASSSLLMFAVASVKMSRFRLRSADDLPA